MVLAMRISPSMGRGLVLMAIALVWLVIGLILGRIYFFPIILLVGGAADFMWQLNRDRDR
jgi:hypothetical protein